VNTCNVCLYQLLADSLAVQPLSRGLAPLQLSLDITVPAGSRVVEKEAAAPEVRLSARI